jgi:PAS domain S-box-containing protein
MKKRIPGTLDSVLRQEAEKKLKRKSSNPIAQLPESDVLKLLHELQVHQIELEMQSLELKRANLRAAELATEKYVELYDFAPSGYFTLSKSGVIINLNLFGSQLLGKDRSSLKNRFFSSYVDDNYKSEFNYFLERVSVSNAKVNCELVLKSDNQNKICVFLSGISTDNGENSLITAIDITSLKQTESALIESRERFYNLVELAVDGVLIGSPDGNITDANSFICAMVGRNKEEIIGKHISDFYFTPESIKKSPFEFDRLRNGEIVVNERNLVRKDGTEITVEMHSKMMPDKSYQSIYRDITERKKMEETLLESELFLKETQIIANLGTYKFDITADTWTSSETLNKILGIESDFHKTFETWSSIIHPAYQQDMIKYFNEEVVGKRKLFDREYKIVRQNDQAIRWVHGMGRLQLDKNNYPTHMIGTIRDITESKQAEEALQESHTLLRIAENTAKIGGWSFVVGEKTMKWSNEVANIHEKSPEYSPLIEEAFEFYAPEWRNKVSEVFYNCLNNGIPFDEEMEIITASGNRVWVQSIGEAIKDKSGKIIKVQGAFQDINDRKHADIILKENENKYKTLFEGADDAIFILDGAKFIECNQKTESLFKCKKADLLNHTVIDFSPAIQPDGQESATKADEKINEAYKGNPQFFEWKHQSLDGRCFDTEVNLNRLELQGMIYIQAIVRDITDRKIAEAEIESKSIEVLKLMAEKDKLYSIIAHDLRSPFNVFLGFTQMMAEDLPRLRSEEIQLIAKMMRASANKLYSLLENLLEWSRIQRGLSTYVPKSLLLKKTVAESLVTVKPIADHKGVSIEFNIPEEIMVLANENMLGSIIRNLTTNAIKYTEKGGEIKISSRISEKNFVQVSVSDNGIGMNQLIIDNLFSLNEVTSRKGTEGEASTGLGLIICKEFVDKIGGKIWVESKVDEGSTFFFTIPADTVQL